MSLLDHPGLIAVPCRPDHARHVEFFRRMLQLQAPAGSRVEMYPGFFAHQNRNAAVREALSEDRAWVLILEDDVVLPPDALLRLLAHDADIVSANLLCKEAPFQPYMFFATDNRGAGYTDTFDGRTGVIDVAACGLGCMLIRTEVFRRLPDPWFAVDDYLATDDLWFCREARKAGYTIRVDLDVPARHMAQCAVWPHYEPGEGWVTAITIGALTFHLPAAVKKPEYTEWARTHHQPADPATKE